MNEETVSLIASGYDWQCPNCGNENMEMEYSEKVVCKECSEIFKADLPDHAFG